LNYPRHSQGLIIVCPSGPVQESPKGDHPFQMLIFTLLLPDVLSNYAFIQSSQSDKITPRLNVFSGKILRPALAFPRNRKSTLPFDETDHVRYRVFGPDAQTHVDIICHHMASTTSQSFCFVSSRNTLAKCRRMPKNCFRLRLGINTTWYLLFHLVRLKL